VIFPIAKTGCTPTLIIGTIPEKSQKIYRADHSLPVISGKK
jgi:hypothetical protein